MYRRKHSRLSGCHEIDIWMVVMQMEIVLKSYDGTSEKAMVRFIIAFFRAHHSQIDEAQAKEDLADWIKEDHELYDILGDGTPVGFVHLNWRGATVCWIEDIFVEDSFRRQGIASKAIGLVEEELQKRGVEGICMDVVPDNISALRLYHRLGYDRLSIITVRKDMQPFATERREQIGGMDFRVKQFSD